MPATSAPFGLRPNRHPSGRMYATAMPGGIASGYAANIFKGSAVKLATTGKIQVAAAGELILGVFAGVEYTTSQGRVFSKHWPTGQVAEDIVAYVYQDPDIIYEIQVDATLTDDSKIGECADFTAAADDTGSTVTGLSNATLSATTGTTTAQFQIVGLAPYANNAFADAFPIVLVRIAEHAHRAPVAAGI